MTNTNFPEAFSAEWEEEREVQAEINAENEENFPLDLVVDEEKHEDVSFGWGGVDSPTNDEEFEKEDEYYHNIVNHCM